MENMIYPFSMAEEILKVFFGLPVCLMKKMNVIFRDGINCFNGSA